MKQLIPGLILAIALGGVLTTSPAIAEEEMQVSGISVLSDVEQHVMPSSVNPKGVFMVGKMVGMTSAPGWFDAMKVVATGTHAGDAASGHGIAKGDVRWTNNDGSIDAGYLSTITYTGDGTGTYEGDFDFRGGSGRFVNVRGHAHMSGQYDHGNISDKWTGKITGMPKE